MFPSTYIVIIAMFSIVAYAQPTDQIRKSHPSLLKVQVVEHQPTEMTKNDQSKNVTSQSTTEKTLIRVTRLQENIPKRQRRQFIEAIQTAGFVISVAKAVKNTDRREEILGMAKTVAIVVIVICSLCGVFCLITTVVICVKCCCGNKDRKRNRAPTTIQVPQPIFVQTGSSGHPVQSWNSGEIRPMLPQPSAPPQPIDHFHNEYLPPPYEKLYQGK